MWSAPAAAEAAAALREADSACEIGFSWRSRPTYFAVNVAGLRKPIGFFVTLDGPDSSRPQDAVQPAGLHPERFEACLHFHNFGRA